jgi:hypothetical protein
MRRNNQTQQHRTVPESRFSSTRFVYINIEVEIEIITAIIFIITHTRLCSVNLEQLLQHEVHPFRTLKMSINQQVAPIRRGSRQ